MFSEPLGAEGAVMFAKACELGLEGVVSKREGSPCRSGRRRN
jgi:ATP-dependent DNA ligase